MQRLRRHATACRIIGLLVILTLAASAWHIVILRAVYAALEAAPEGQAAGPPVADVTIIEFMDYRCTPCRALRPVINTVMQRHPDVRIVFRNAPAHGPESVREALYALAAGKQGRFAAMNDLLLSHENEVTAAELPALCEQAQVDCAKLQADTADPALRRELDTTLRGVRVLGVKAVPAFMVNRTIYTASRGMPTVDNFDMAIGQARSQLKR